MGLRDFFMKQAIEITPEQLDLLLEAEERATQKVSRAQAISLPAVYANTELIAIL